MNRDWWMCAAVVVLAVFGFLLQVRLAGTVPALEGTMPLLAGMIAGVVAAAACGGGRAGRFLEGKGKWIAFGVALALMLALLAFGRRYRGGLYLPGRINPSEIVKLCLVAFLAGWLGRRKFKVGKDVKVSKVGKDVKVSKVSKVGKVGKDVKVSKVGKVGKDVNYLNDVKDLKVFNGLALCGILLLLVAAAGDFGLLAQLAITVAAILWASSWAWGSLSAIVLAGGIAFVAAHPSGHLATRFAVWRDPFGDVTGAGWQTLQGLTAILSGGMTGAGFGLGDVQSVPIVASDFVYAAVAEELGLVGCAVVLVLWAFVFARGLRTAARRAAEAPAEAMLATGIVASLAVQLVLNVAGVLNALPMTGITLPLISLGGSSQATTLLMCGVLVGISCASAQEE